MSALIEPGYAGDAGHDGPRLTVPGPRKVSAVVPLAGYLILALIFLSRTWLGGALGRRLMGRGGDPLGFVWFLAWLPHALGAGHSPFFTTAIMAPQGAHLLNSTAIPLPSLLLWPITTTLGPVTSYNVLATLAVTASASAAYLALVRITPHRSSAWIGGLLYGFGGYMAGQATDHVNLMIVVFPPVAAILIDDIRRGRSPVRTGLLLGVCAAAQIFINEEVLAATTIMALPALAYLAWTRRPPRAVAERYVHALAAAAIAFAVIAGPALVYQLLGPQHVTGMFVYPDKYVNDLAGFVVPSMGQVLSTGGSRHLTSGFSGTDGELGSYLGVPLICVLIWAGWRLRRRALFPAFLLTCAVILSLGPRLHVAGHDTAIYLPWILPNQIPFLENAVPDRFNLFIWLAAAVLFVLLIDDLRARPFRGRPALGLAICAVALVPVVPSLAPSETTVLPRVIGNASVFRHRLPGVRIVLITPVNNGQLAMYAEAESDFAYRIAEGGVFVPNADGPSYGMRHGPLLSAMSTLSGYVAPYVGQTRTAEACLAEGDATELNRTCRSYYLRALRALKIDAVIVSNLGSASAKAHYRWFFRSLLGPSVGPGRTRAVLS